MLPLYWLCSEQGNRQSAQLHLPHLSDPAANEGRGASHLDSHAERGNQRLLVLPVSGGMPSGRSASLLLTATTVKVSIPTSLRTQTAGLSPSPVGRSAVVRGNPH